MYDKPAHRTLYDHSTGAKHILCHVCVRGRVCVCVCSLLFARSCVYVCDPTCVCACTLSCVCTRVHDIVCVCFCHVLYENVC